MPQPGSQSVINMGLILERRESAFSHWLGALSGPSGIHMRSSSRKGHDTTQYSGTVAQTA